MIKNILIIEDNPSEVKYYQDLSGPEREISLLFLAANKDYTKEKLRELIELLYGTSFLKIKDYFVYTKDTIIEFLTNNPFDFYIIDSLEGIAESLVVEAGLVEEKVAFLSSTKSFIESVRKKGYKAYLKKDVDRLIQECF